MRIVRERETEVSDVRRLIDRLGHCAHDQRFNEGALRGVAHATRDRLQITCAHTLWNPRIDAERPQGRHEPLELLVLGLPVDAIERRHLSPLERFGHRDVREDHALLDEAVRVVARAQLDAPHPLARVDDELRFCRIEIERPPAVARLIECAIDIDEHHEGLEQRTELRASRRPAGEECVVGERVGEARSRAHHGGIEARALQGAGAAHHHVGRKAQSIDARRQRAQMIREGRRQHRQHARRKVDRCAARLRFGIERRSRPHVVAHVRNRDDEAEAAGAPLGVHRIVEIPRVLPVDRHQRELAQVRPRARLAAIHLLAVRLRLAQRRRRKLVRQIGARDRGLGGELDRSIGIQALADHRLRGRRGAGVTRDPRNDPVAVACAVQIRRRHRAAQLQPAVGRVHPGAAALDLHRAEERGHAALQHLLHGARPAIACIA